MARRTISVGMHLWSHTEASKQHEPGFWEGVMGLLRIAIRAFVRAIGWTCGRDLVRFLEGRR